MGSATSRITRHARRWAALLAATGLAVTTAGCGSDGGSGSGGDKLTVYVYGDASVKVQQSAVDRFNKTSDVKVDLVSVPGNNYVEKLRAAMGSPKAPDILFNWGGGSIKPYVDAGQLMDLTPVLAKDKALKDAFLPSVLDAGKVDGKNYGIPMRGIQPVILFYNKTLFAKHDLQPPKTYDELLQLVEAFKAKGITPFALGGADVWPEQMWLQYLLDRIGGSEVFARIQSGDSSGWGDPAVLEAATKAKELVDKGAFGKNFLSVAYNGGGASTLFAKGRAAMHLMGSWENAQLLEGHKEFVEKDLAWTSFPTVAGGKGDPASVVGNPTNYWSVNKRTKHKDAALAFVKAMSDAKYSEDLILNGDVPATTSAKSLLDTAPNPGFAKYQYDLVDKAPNFTLSWDQALPSKIATPMATEIGKLFAGKTTPEKFVETMKGLK
jgi:xylobiose transport system substrate-binding protein